MNAATVAEPGASPLVRRWTDGDLALLEIAHAPVNALAQPVRAALLAAIEAADGDAAVHAILILGAGDTFVAGAEIRELERPAVAPVLADVLLRVEACGKPVVACIRGHALGGGLELALACHYRVATAGASLGLPEVKLGLLPGAGGTQRLPRLVGAAAALDLMLGGEPVDAARARTLGILDDLVEPDAWPAAALDWTREQLAAGAPVRRLRERAAPSPLSDANAQAALSQHARALRGIASGPCIVECVRAAAALPFDEAHALSRRLFEECRTSLASLALRHLFFAERAVGRCAGQPRAVAHVLVVGAGTMGTGIAIALADAGLETWVVDVDAAALARGRARFASHYSAQIKRGRCSEQQASQRQGSTHFVADFAAGAHCDLAIEAAFESLEVKRQVFERLDACLPADAVLATNTSYLDVDRIAAATRRPQAVLGLHFFSPANIMRLVEVVRASATSPDVLATGAALARRLRKLPVIVGNATGFVGNRMLQAYGRESQLLLLEGATPEQVDRALQEFGMAMGPCAVYDLAGLDIGYRARRERSDRPDDPRYFRVADALVEAGRLGQKSAAGHYRYDAGGSRQPDPEVDRLIEGEATRLAIARRMVTDAEIVERCSLALIVEGASLLESGVAGSAADIDVVWTNGYGFPRYRGGPMHHAEALGARQVVQRVESLAVRHGAQYWTVPPALRARAAAEGTVDRPPTAAPAPPPEFS